MYFAKSDSKFAQRAEISRKFAYARAARGHFAESYHEIYLYGLHFAGPYTQTPSGSALVAATSFDRDGR